MKSVDVRLANYSRLAVVLKGMKNLLIPPRTESVELLDLGSEPVADINKSLDDLRRINRYFGGWGILKKTLIPLLDRVPAGATVRILDIGSGGSDMIERIACGYPGKDLHLIFLDIRESHLLAGRALPRDHSYVAGDAFELPFGTSSCDIVVSNLLLHHHYDTAGRLLHEMHRVCRTAVVVTDLLRHRVPLLAARLFGRMLGWNRITRHDAIVSIARAFSKTEMEGLLAGNGFIRRSVSVNWAFRFGAVIWKETE
jgi:SAM-dependent methyltransferase